MSFYADQIWVAIPALDERDWLPATIASLAGQSVQGFNVMVCVNQPEAWWSDPLKRDICLRNMEVLDALRADADILPFRLHILDRCSPGNGWPQGRGGAGMARRTVMDEACRLGGASSVIVSADADTLFDPTYLGDIADRLTERPDATAIAAPYYHPLTGNEAVDKSIIRYELFLRLYLMNLMRIRSPYAFTAIGSAIAITAEGYRKTGGVPLLQSGEDFYLLQKAVKTGKVLTALPSKVYPAARFSHRVPFGTGPAIASGLNGDWAAYPFIHPRHFDTISEFYQLIPGLFVHDLKTPVDDFLTEQFGSSEIWHSLRSNCASVNTFAKAVHQKVDGLRLWQMLRRKGREDYQMVAFLEGIRLIVPELADMITSHPEKTPLPHLIILRDQLFETEMKMRISYDEAI
jgi:hypothetical protein